MRKSILPLSFTKTLLLWFCAISVCLSQSPEPDLDSITEDSYRRMQARQKAEKESDTIKASAPDSILITLDSKEPKEHYYLMLIFVIVGIGFLYWYIRSTSKKRDTSKK